MGLFNRFRPREAIDYIEHELEQPEIQTQLWCMAIFIVAVSILRILSGSRLKALSGEHVLDVSALNHANLYKEVFLAYLNAALLEPVLAIGGMEKVVGQECVISIFTLGSICWWIYLISDAFDYDDVMQHFKYHVDLRKEIEQSKTPNKYHWMKFKSRDEDAQMERASLVGSLQRDVALWFMIACIGAAWLPGVVTHRDVLHAYVVVFLWAFLHHWCRKATTWSTGYVCKGLGTEES